MCMYGIVVKKHEIEDFPVSNLEISSLYRGLIDEDDNTRRHSLRCTKQQPNLAKASNTRTRRSHKLHTKHKG